MSQLSKILDKIKRIPIRSDIEFDELEKVYEYYGFIKKEGKGSHVKFTHSIYKELNTIVPRPHNNSRTVKRIYIKILQEYIKYIENKEKRDEK